MFSPAVDTAGKPAQDSIIDSVIPDSAYSQQKQVKVVDTVPLQQLQKPVVKKKDSDTLSVVRTRTLNPYKKAFNASDNFLVSNPLKSITVQSGFVMTKDTALKATITTQPQSAEIIKLHEREYKSSDWELLVYFIIVLLFIWIRVFYNKFFTFLANSLVSYQLSAKVFQEKNVLLKRVSFVLDVIYHIVLAIFLYKIFSVLELSPAKMTSYNLFLFFLNILILYTLIRIAVLKVFGYLFKAESIISEYVHNNFIINKSMGIALIPVSVAIGYMPAIFTGTLLVAGLLILGLGNVFKAIRGYQIIIRKDVFFFYMILYLCTLEILPLLLGYKVFISLL